MRINSFMAILASLFLVLCIGFNILYKTYHCESPDQGGLVQWAQLAIFLAAIAGFNTPFVYGKIQQKRTELQAENKKT